MTWPATEAMVGDQQGEGFDTLVERLFGTDAAPDTQEVYDLGYADGLAAGGGGGVPTEGQIWPRRG